VVYTNKNWCGNIFIFVSINGRRIGFIFLLAFARNAVEIRGLAGKASLLAAAGHSEVKA